MKMGKGQADILSAILIVLLAMGLLGTAYAYGIPLIQKRQDTAVVDRANSYFLQTNVNSLPSKIENIANSGGETTFSLDVNGVWNLYPCADRDALGNFMQGCGNFGANNNSIEFSFISKVANIAVDRGWVSMTSGTSCPPKSGMLGVDKSSVVCAKAESVEGGLKTTYRIWFREVSDSSGNNAFKINILQHPSSSVVSSGENVKILFGSRREQTSGEKKLIITEIKILLV